MKGPWAVDPEGFTDITLERNDEEGSYVDRPRPNRLHHIDEVQQRRLRLD